MHMMGKVGVWLVVIVAIVATLLTSKLIQVRDSWTKKLVAQQKALETLRPKIAAQTEELAALEAERFRAREFWGDYWKDVPTAVQAGGSLVINIGTAVAAANTKDVFLREKQTLYGFETLPDGQMFYRGDFTVVTARDAQSQLQPNWGVRTDDIQTWQQQANWRWRVLIPVKDYQPTFDTQIEALRKSDDLLADRKKTLENEIKLEGMAQEQLKLREQELVGGPLLPKDSKIAPEFRDGLVVAVEQVEEERNRVLIKVDELRRKLREVQRNVDRVSQSNVELTNKLPVPQNAAVSKTE